jgi:hypothetical protein
MIRNLKLTLTFAFLLSFLVINSLMPLQAQAYTSYTLIAVAGQGTYDSGFTLKYEDRDSDGKFSLDELGSFSYPGLSFPLWDPAGRGWTESETVLEVPAEGLYCDGGGIYQTANLWLFQYYNMFLGEPHLNWWWADASNYDYTRVTEAPLPPSAYLLVTGLLGLVGLRRL